VRCLSLALEIGYFGSEETNDKSGNKVQCLSSRTNNVFRLPLCTNHYDGARILCFSPSSVHRRSGRETGLPITTPRHRPSRQPLGIVVILQPLIIVPSMLTVESIEHCTYNTLIEAVFASDTY